MTIDIRGIDIDRALRTHIEKQLTDALGRLVAKSATAQVTFFDVGASPDKEAAR